MGVSRTISHPACQAEAVNYTEGQIDDPGGHNDSAVS